MIYLANHPARLGSVLSWAMLCLLLVFPATATEPSYEGKPLSEWLLNPEGKDGNDEAILHIGSNGIPTLLKLLGATESNRGRVLKSLDYDLLKKAEEGRGVGAQTLRDTGVTGFRLLGTNAAAAVGEITRLFYGNETRLQAAVVLTFIGPKGFSVLTNALDRGGQTDDVILALGQSQDGDVKTITKLLIHALNNESWSIRGNAAGALAGKDPELAVPALVQMLDDRSTYAAGFAAHSLASYGPAAKSAGPKLLGLYTNILTGSDEERIRDLGDSVLRALRATDRQAAAKAEAFLLSTGPTNPARSGYFVTALPNGKNLIAGGCIHMEIPTVTNRLLKSAQLLDRATGKWVETGEMAVGHYEHNAISLANGKVLLVGGFGVRGGDSTSAELYDIATGLWRLTGSPNHAHGTQVPVLQGDGKVRIEDEIYDPGTEKWTVVPKK